MYLFDLKSNKWCFGELEVQEAIHFELTTALKMALKSRGITYKELAERISVSEQTIKRLFRDKDCTLSRITQICDAIDLSVYDLFEFSKTQHEPQTELSAEQMLFLSEHGSHFNFLIFLISGYKPERIQETYQLSDVHLFAYMRDLDKYGLIELGANNQYRLLVEGHILMKVSGPLGKFVREYNQAFMQHVFEKDGFDGAGFNSSFRHISADTLQALNDDLLALSKKFRKAAYQDAAIMPREKLIAVKWSTLVAPYEICGEWPMDQEVKV